MAKRKMTNKKIYMKIKKTGVVSSIIRFFVLSFISTLALLLTLTAFGEYMLENGLSNEYNNIKDLAAMYEGGKGEDFNNLYRLLNKKGVDYIITDKDGNIIYKNCEDTREDKLLQKSLYAGGKEKVDLYFDSEDNQFFISGEYVNTNFINFIVKCIRSENDNYISEDEEEASEEDEIDDYFSEIDGNVDLFEGYPLWMSVTVGEPGSEEHFIGKANFNVKRRNFDIFKFTMVTEIALVIILLASMLTVAIKNIIKQVSITKFFFKDATTGGKNWMFYQIKGEQLITKFKYRHAHFALVNLVFINYRNYCVCHSVAEGEILLQNIYNVIVAALNRNEICSHVTTSNFGLILRYENVEGLRERLDKLLKSLEEINAEHKFCFQAGVSLLDDAVDSSGRPLSKKQIDIVNEYNNACTARAELSETDETGVAFFDEKIVENQKWLDMVQERQKRAVVNEEFQVYYQPKYNPKTNELRGAEALIRWQSPDLGFVTPYKFIPIFEKNGFITEIDHFMITHAARDQKRWLDRGFKCVPISVNVSRAHFIESDLAEQIRDMVDNEGCPRQLIEIELTESAFFDDKKAMIDTINKLKGYGFSVSMDDFGAGYSSLNSLKDMPLDVLKLDADFFRGGSEDGRGEKVISEAITLAKRLDMRVVAEGVEDKEQVEFLAELNCDMIQGFYYAKPMPGLEYEQRMTSVNNGQAVYNS